MQCVILAGGRGTRMAPLTDSVPKTLIQVAGRPFADWQLAWLAAEGVDRVTYSVGHLGECIQEHVGSGRRWGLDVRYVDEGEEPRGTGGALRLALEDDALDDRFFVLYGDSFLRVHLVAVWDAFEKSGKSALMTVFRNDGELEASNAVFEGGLVTRYEKGLSDAPTTMCFIDYGLSLFRRSTIERWVPSGTPVDLAAVFTKLSSAGELAGFEAHERFFEVGSPEGLDALERQLGHK